MRRLLISRGTTHLMRARLLLFSYYVPCWLESGWKHSTSGQKHSRSGILWLSTRDYTPMKWMNISLPLFLAAMPFFFILSSCQSVRPSAKRVAVPVPPKSPIQSPVKTQVRASSQPPEGPYAEAIRITVNRKPLPAVLRFQDIAELLREFGHPVEQSSYFTPPLAENLQRIQGIIRPSSPLQSILEHSVAETGRLPMAGILSKAVATDKEWKIVAETENRPVSYVASYAPHHIPFHPHLAINNGKALTFATEKTGTTTEENVSFKNLDLATLAIKVHIGSPFSIDGPSSFSLNSGQTRDLGIRFTPNLSVSDSLRMGPKIATAVSSLEARFEDQWMLPNSINVDGTFSNFVESKDTVYLTNATIAQVSVPETVTDGMFFLIRCVAYYDANLVVILPKGFVIDGDGFKLDTQLPTSTTYVTSLKVARESTTFDVPVFSEEASSTNRVVVLNTVGS